MSERLYFGVLGPLTVRRDGAALPVTAAMPRAILAALLLEANRPVAAGRLRTGLWPESQPRCASASLHNHVHRLRRGLGDFGRDRIRAAPSGYLLEIHDGELDLHAFLALHEHARRARRDADWAEVFAAVSRMLALWRGEPVADVAHPVLADAERERLAEMRVQALDWWAEAGLRLGRHADLLIDLRALTCEFPLVETFAAHLMLALHRSGRHSDALDAYSRTRTALRDELGANPGAGLVSLHGRILERDPGLEWRPEGWRVAPSEVVAAVR